MLCSERNGKSESERKSAGASVSCFYNTCICGSFFFFVFVRLSIICDKNVCIYKSLWDGTVAGGVKELGGGRLISTLQIKYNITINKLQNSTSNKMSMISVIFW